MNSTKLMGWMLILGPVVTFITGLLTSFLVGQGNTPTEAVQEIMDNQNLTTILTVVNSLGFVSALVGATLVSKTMSGEDKKGGIFGQISTILFVGLTTLAIATTLSNLATVGAIQSAATDTAAITAANTQIMNFLRSIPATRDRAKKLEINKNVLPKSLCHNIIKAKAITAIRGLLNDLSSVFLTT